MCCVSAVFSTAVLLIVPFRKKFIAGWYIVSLFFVSLYCITSTSFFCFHFYASDALSLELVGSAREIGDTVKINLFL